MLRKQRRKMERGKRSEEEEIKNEKGGTEMSGDEISDNVIKLTFYPSAQRTAPFLWRAHCNADPQPVPGFLSESRSLSPCYSSILETCY
jgi:hypothetical protein